MQPESVQLTPLFEDTKKRIEFAAKTLNVEPELVARWAAADPTQNGEFILWLAKQFKSKALVFPEDVDKCRDTLGIFAKVKNKAAFLAPKDINAYKTYGDVAEAVMPYKDLMSKRELKTRALDDVSELCSVGPYKAFYVSSEEAAIRLFRGTEWCVRDPRHFYNYNGYIYVEKDGKAFVLFAESPIQLKDLLDRDVSRFDPDLIRLAFTASPSFGYTCADFIKRGVATLSGSKEEKAALAEEFPAMRKATAGAADLASKATSEEEMIALAAEGTPEVLAALAKNPAIDAFKGVPLERVDRSLLSAQEKRAKAYGVAALSPRAQLTLGLYTTDAAVLKELVDEASTPVLYALVRRVGEFSADVQANIAEVFANKGTDSVVRKILTGAKLLKPPVSDRLAARVGYNLRDQDDRVNYPRDGVFSSNALAKIIIKTAYKDFSIAEMLEAPADAPNKALVDAIAEAINTNFTPSRKPAALKTLYHLARFPYGIMSADDYAKLDQSVLAPEWKYSLGLINKDQLLAEVDASQEIARRFDVSLVKDLPAWSVADRTRLVRGAWMDDSEYISLMDMGLSPDVLKEWATLEPSPQHPSQGKWISHANKLLKK